MSKRRKFEDNITPADKYIPKMNLKDIKRECVIRGLEFKRIVYFSIPQLTNWLRDHFYDPTDHKKLDEFDEWFDNTLKAELESRGEKIDQYFHPSLRLGYIAETDEDGNVIKRKKARTIIKKKKKKRERTRDGIFTGTKKAYTFELQKQGKDKATTIKMVMEKFPDASEKSISIWYNKSKKS